MGSNTSSSRLPFSCLFTQSIRPYYAPCRPNTKSRNYFLLGAELSEETRLQVEKYSEKWPYFEELIFSSSQIQDLKNQESKDKIK